MKQRIPALDQFILEDYKDSEERIGALSLDKLKDIYGNLTGDWECYSGVGKRKLNKQELVNLIISDEFFEPGGEFNVDGRLVPADAAYDYIKNNKIYMYK